MSNYIVLGAQWGDEGKGKIVDMLSAEMDMVVRFQGGANAGHTVICGDEKYVLHLIPGGIVSGKAVNVIGNGCVVDPVIFSEEVDYLLKKNVVVNPDKIIISLQAHMVTPVHKYMDKVLNKHIGTTGRGIGPAYGDKITRTGIRMESVLDGTFLERFCKQADNARILCERVYQTEFLDIKQAEQELAESVERVRPFIKDSVEIISAMVKSGGNVLFEGAQGTLLDIDHGTYPFVTSSSTSIGGALTGSGVFVDFNKRIGIVKAYTTRVGEGPFPTELFDETGERLRKNGNEFGATTGRPRRCGWLDLKQLKRSFIINGFNYISMSKISCLSGFDYIKAAVDYDVQGKPVYKTFGGWSEEVEGATSLEQLPSACKEYIDFIEDYLNVPVGMISTGPDREHIIFKQPLF
ncbi:MAG: adenylosuccinate synthase [Calditrichaceae bacterium]|nr:adenylosuccinate synthase [Calditrichaceae bacterium]